MKLGDTFSFRSGGHSHSGSVTGVSTNSSGGSHFDISGFVDASIGESIAGMILLPIAAVLTFFVAIPMGFGYVVNHYVYHWDFGKGTLIGPYFWPIWVSGIGALVALLFWALPRPLWIPAVATGLALTFILAPYLSSGKYYIVHPERRPQAIAQTSMLRSHQWKFDCYHYSAAPNANVDNYYNLVPGAPCTAADASKDNLLTVGLTSNDLHILEDAGGRIYCNPPGDPWDSAADFKRLNFGEEDLELWCPLSLQGSGSSVTKNYVLRVVDQYGQPVFSQTVKIPGDVWYTSGQLHPVTMKQNVPIYGEADPKSEQMGYYEPGDTTDIRGCTVGASITLNGKTSNLWDRTEEGYVSDLYLGLNGRIYQCN